MPKGSTPSELTAAVVGALEHLSQRHPPSTKEIAVHLDLEERMVRVALTDLHAKRMYRPKRDRNRFVWVAFR